MTNTQQEKHYQPRPEFVNFVEQIKPQLDDSLNSSNKY